MSECVNALGHLGPDTTYPPVAAFNRISTEAFRLYTEAANGFLRRDQDPREPLVTRMMHVAEATSIAVRLNASWALTHPALSLLRDRYEQTVRFSWLARNPDDEEWLRYLMYFFAKSGAVSRHMPQGAKESLPEEHQEHDHAVGNLSKEQRDYLSQWGKLDLKTMVQRRDKLPALGRSRLATHTLFDFYATIYMQYSSVTHYDMYSMSIVNLEAGKEGKAPIVLASDPYWPAAIGMHLTLFDLIQCYEVGRRFLKKKNERWFNLLFREWDANMRRCLAEDRTKPPKL